MGFVDGLVVRTFEEAKQLEEPARAAAGNSLVDVLSRIHGADVDVIGLGDLGKREGYIARQLKRWYGQFEKSNELTGRPVPLVHEVHDRLAARIPEQGDAAIVHGDYRLDNCLVGPDGEVRAVLDWEICTLGDPLADLGLLLVYWAQTGDDRPALPGAATSAPGFPTRDELIAAYADRSTRDLSQLEFYVAFGYWKLACILEGVYSRYAGGAMGDATGFEGFGEQVGYLAEAASNAADRLP
jgi:aminoglycoside phosphotransferase (APT) family kinase protein